jgi:hypothetical protein
MTHVLHIRWIMLIVQTVAVMSASTLQAQAAVRDAEFQAGVDAGLAAYQAGRYGDARQSFARAHDARPSARTFRALGITDFALDAFSAAHRELSAALTDPREPISSEQREEVKALLDWMHSKLASMQLERTPRNAEVFIDGARADADEVWIFPGEHRIHAAASGHRGYARTLSLRAGAGPQPLAIVLQPESSNVATSNTWLWIGGASLLAIAAGGTMFGLGRLQIDNVEQPGPPFRQPSEAEAEQQRGRWLTGLGIGLCSAGILGVATAIVLGMRAEHSNPRPNGLTLSLGPSQLAVQGSF